MTPIKAYRNIEFLTSPNARALRILAEYVEPETRFEKEGVDSTVVFFGSARVRPREEAERSLAAAEKRGAPAEMLLELRSHLKLSRYYEEARELARMLTAWSRSIGTDPEAFVVSSGGGPGIMEAANRGAADAGGRSIGLNISLPSEQGSNPFITEELNLEFHYFFMRKLWFVQLACAMVIFPGGFGTLDELCEVLTLMQTARSPADADDRLRPRVLERGPEFRRAEEMGGYRSRGPGPVRLVQLSARRLRLSAGAVVDPLRLIGRHSIRNRDSTWASLPARSRRRTSRLCPPDGRSTVGR